VRPTNSEGRGKFGCNLQRCMCCISCHKLQPLVTTVFIPRTHPAVCVSQQQLSGQADCEDRCKSGHGLERNGVSD